MTCESEGKDDEGPVVGDCRVLTCIDGVPVPKHLSARQLRQKLCQSMKWMGELTEILQASPPMPIPPMSMPPIAVGVALDEGMLMLMLMLMSMAVDVAPEPISMASVANTVQEQSNGRWDKSSSMDDEKKKSTMRSSIAWMTGNGGCVFL